MGIKYNKNEMKIASVAELLRKVLALCMIENTGFVLKIPFSHYQGDGYISVTSQNYV